MKFQNFSKSNNAVIWLAWAVLLAVWIFPAWAQLPELPDEVAARIQSRITNEYCPGFVVGLINSNGVQFYRFGTLSWEIDQPVNEDTVFEIGSVTKTFTGALLSDMVLKGELGLDDPAQRHLPNWVHVPTHNGKAITLQHLATHTACLPYNATNLQTNDAALAFSSYSAQDLYDFLSNYRLSVDPGVSWSYSNVGMGLLGHVLCLRSGLDYETLVAERITKELGMPDTTITLKGNMASRCACGYCGVAARPALYCGIIPGWGGLRSTARDLMTYLAANMGIKDTRLYPTLTHAHQPQFAVNDNLQMGLGWMLTPTESDEVIWHEGGSLGCSSFVGFLRQAKLGVVVLANSYLDITTYLGLHVLAPEVPLGADEIPVNVPLSFLRDYVGHFAHDAEGFDIALERGHLTFIHSSQRGMPFTFYASSEQTFYVHSLVLDTTATFERNAEGKVTSLLSDLTGTSVRYTKVSEPARLTLQQQSGRRLLSLTGDSDAQYVIEASSDLKAWMPISTNTIWEMPMEDTASCEFDRRFYRAHKK